MAISMDAAAWKRLAEWVKHGLSDNPTAAIELSASAETQEVTLRVVGDTVARAHANGDVAEDLDVAVPGKLFAELLRHVAAGVVTVQRHEEGNQLTVTSGRSTFTLPLATAQQVTVTQPDAFGEIDTAAFAAAVAQVAPSADLSGGPLSAVLVSPDTEAGVLTLVATNRYRMAVAHVPYTPAAGSDDEDLLISAKALAGQVKAVKSDTVTLQRRDGVYGFTGAGHSIHGRLVSGAYAPWERAMSMADNATTTVTVSAADLLGAVKRCSLVANMGAADAAPGLFELSSGNLRITAGDGQFGEAEETVAVQQTGDDLSVRMNMEYVVAGLHATADADVTFQLSGPQRAVLMSTVPDGDGEQPFRYLIMPLAS